MDERQSDGFVREIQVDVAANEADDERVVRRLVDATAGIGSCTISAIRTPAGGGSPEGRHVHAVDQIFIVLRGTMQVEVGGRQEEAAAGSVVVFPAGTPHRNWNGGTTATVHLAISAPAPDPSVAFATRVD